MSYPSIAAGRTPVQLRRATIIRYNGNGQVHVAIDDMRLADGKLEYDVDLPLAWSGPNGEFMGGFPPIGAPVVITRAHGGEWFIVSYIRPNDKFTNLNVFGTGGLDRNLMSDLQPGRILLKTAITKGLQNMLYIDPTEGTHVGAANNFARFDPLKNIFSHNFNNEYAFTEGHRSIKGRIKRDVEDNSLRNVSASILESHEYDSSLYDVSMDPSNRFSFISTGTYARNLPLVESREIIYEFANNQGINFTTDEDEAQRYKSFERQFSQNSVYRTDSRADAFNLSLNYPNHLIEIIRGTGVDALGNILDLNRNILPIGKDDEYALNRNKDGNVEAFRKIRALHRRALAYHLEINTRKRTGNDDVSQAPNVLAVSDATQKAPDHGRDRSRFFFDVDKEGQFKLNIPSSSETGNIPLLTRYETATSIMYAEGTIDDPNLFKRANVDGEDKRQDIFHDEFSNDAPVELSDYAVLNRLNNDSKINYGTAFHNIANTCLQFQNRAKGSLVGYSPSSLLNQLDPIDTIVSNSITTYGDNANAGGRSGAINLDGFVSLNVGANTIDRQSLWADYAGGIVANIGRDLRGRSYIGNYDGDIFIQVGGSALGNGTDSRFANQNDAFRQGVFDLRVVQGSTQGSNGGQLFIIRVDGDGLKIASYGRVEIVAAQDMIFRTRGILHLDAEEVIMFSGSPNQRRILRTGKEM
jgi:hypothetical protein